MYKVITKLDLQNSFESFKSGNGITGLMACDPNGLIGCRNGLPWSIESEMCYFRKTIAEQVLIMGRKTFECLPKLIFKSCVGIVFSRTKRANEDNVIYVSSLDDFRKLELPVHKKLFMIGGAEIAHLFMKNHLIEEFILTKIHTCYEGDVFLDLNMLQEWDHILISEHTEYSIYKLIKK